MNRSRSHLVLIPSYNTGPRLLETVAGALAQWRPVWVVIDGSDDGSELRLSDLASTEPDLRILRLSKNGGKGTAVIAGMQAAIQAGFTRALVMDADGQHPADRIPLFMGISDANPDAMVLGVPQFGSDAPASRRNGRLIGNWWTHLETLWGGVEDSLFGFRVYPIPETLNILLNRRDGRGYDFDTVTVVRLFWTGIRPINVPVPVRYFGRSEGGVSHFRYWRHNLLLVLRHTCMVLEMPFHFAEIHRNRRRSVAAGLSRSLRQSGETELSANVPAAQQDIQRPRSAGSVSHGF